MPHEADKPDVQEGGRADWGVVGGGMDVPFSKMNFPIAVSSAMNK